MLFICTCWWCPANMGVLIRRCLPWPVPLDLLPSVLTSPPGEIYWRTYTIVPKPMTILGERHTVVVWCATHANRVSLQLVYSKDWPLIYNMCSTIWLFMHAEYYIWLLCTFFPIVALCSTNILYKSVCVAAYHIREHAYNQVNIHQNCSETASLFPNCR